jgi:hypothetical protein
MVNCYRDQRYLTINNAPVQLCRAHYLIPIAGVFINIDPEIIVTAGNRRGCLPFLQRNTTDRKFQADEAMSVAKTSILKQGQCAVFAKDEQVHLPACTNAILSWIYK